MRSKKESRFDVITSKMLHLERTSRPARNVLPFSLHYIIGKQPQAWKLANVAVIYKNNGVRKTLHVLCVYKNPYVRQNSSIVIFTHKFTPQSSRKYPISYTTFSETLQYKLTKSKMDSTSQKSIYDTIRRPKYPNQICHLRAIKVHQKKKKLQKKFCRSFFSGPADAKRCPAYREGRSIIRHITYDSPPSKWSCISIKQHKQAWSHLILRFSLPLPRSFPKFCVSPSSHQPPLSDASFENLSAVSTRFSFT